MSGAPTRLLGLFAVRKPKIGFEWLCFPAPALQAKTELGLFCEFFCARSEKRVSADKTTDKRERRAASARRRIEEKAAGNGKRRSGRQSRGETRSCHC
jgi:hypothetical protein